MIAVAFTHYERYEMLCEALALPLLDARIGEIVVSDDHSTDGSYEKLAALLANEPKVTLVRNVNRIDCYANKAAALRACESDWAILFDSDNTLTQNYLDAIPAHRDPHTAYLPVFAMPTFDYREFAGLTITAGNVAEHVDREMFLTALNTANHVVRPDQYLRAWNPDSTPVTADSIYMNYRWLQMGNALTFVEGMEYHHLIHDGSHFQRNHTNALEEFKRDIEHRLRSMT